MRLRPDGARRTNGAEPGENRHDSAGPGIGMTALDREGNFEAVERAGARPERAGRAQPCGRGRFHLKKDQSLSRGEESMLSLLNFNSSVLNFHSKFDLRLSYGTTK